MCKFQKNEDKANAHAGMPLCGVSRFAVPAFKSVFGCMTKEQQPFGGVGRLCLSFLGMHSLTWINATICAFLVFIQNWRSSLLSRGELLMF